MRLRALPPILLTCLLAACGGEATTTADGASEPAATSDVPSTATPSAGNEDSSSSSPSEVPETLRFTATTVGGEPFEGSSLAGRPALLWFWAPWCPTCRGQIPQVDGLAEEYDGELAVVGIGSLDSAEAIAEFAGDVPGVTHLEDVDGALYQRFGIAEQSSFVLLDAEGEVAFETGYGGAEDLDAQVADVVDQGRR